MSPPIFIIGFQRSGTTLLRLMLDSHPEVAIPLDTTGLWARYEGLLPRYGSLADPAVRRRLVEDLLAEERIRLWETPLTAEDVLARRTGDDYAGIVAGFYRAYAAAKGKARWGDKDPGNMTRIHLLDRWFPDARFVHIIRDGRDACLSHREQEFGVRDLLECADAWREQVTWVRRMGALLGPARYAELRYEDLLADPEGVLRSACRYLDLEYSSEMMNYHRRVDGAIPRSKRHIWKLIDRPPQGDNAERWRREMSRGQRAAFEKRAGVLLRELRYESFPAPPSGAYLEEFKSIVRRAGLALRRRARGAK